MKNSHEAPTPQLSNELSSLLDGQLSVEDFVATIVHEAVQPLTAIQVLATALRTNSEITDEQRALMLEDIESQARYLQDLASWMLEPFPRDRALVDDIVTASVDRSRAIAPSHELECDLSAGNATVDCEVVRVEGSIRNLIKNAVEYSPPEDPIVVSSRAEDGFAVINVRDHGPGIPEEHWKRIFQPYTQIDGPDRSGKGLGLFLVQSCAVQHGGHARVATSGPGGTDMELTLRLSQD